MSAISTELRISLLLSLIITMAYVAISQFGVPESSSVLGYGLGITGFLLMLGAEVLHSWRKLQKGTKYGKIRTWLQAHIIIGLVGPYLVLLHSAWRLNGLAGITMLMTMLMVASGFLLNYIYPALPRNVDGAEITLPELEAQIADANAKLRTWEDQHPSMVHELGQRLKQLTETHPGSDTMAVLGRTLLRWSYQRQIDQELQKLHSAGVEQARELSQLLNRRYLLEAQISSLAAARKLLGQSRTVHIVLGMVLFALVFVHIGAALYYATFAH